MAKSTRVQIYFFTILALLPYKGFSSLELKLYPEQATEVLKKAEIFQHCILTKVAESYQSDKVTQSNIYIQKIHSKIFRILDRVTHILSRNDLRLAASLTIYHYGLPQWVSISRESNAFVHLEEDLKNLKPATNDLVLYWGLPAKDEFFEKNYVSSVEMVGMKEKLRPLEMGEVSLGLTMVLSPDVQLGEDLLKLLSPGMNLDIDLEKVPYSACILEPKNTALKNAIQCLQSHFSSKIYQELKHHQERSVSTQYECIKERKDLEIASRVYEKKMHDLKARVDAVTK